MPSLYEITENMSNLRALFEAEEIDEQTLADTMESLNADMAEKTDGYGAYIADLNAEIEGCKIQIARLTANKKRAESTIDRLKNNLYEAMRAAGQKKIKGALFTARIQKSRASVRVPDAKVIPEEYLIPQEPKVDKDAIYKAFKAGEEIAGAELVQTEGVRIG